MTTLPRHALVGDIGGTNARFAIADLQTMTTAHGATVPGAAYPTLQEAAATYLQRVPVKPTVAAIAVAGPVAVERIQLTNSPWAFTRAEMCEALDLKTFLPVNDFEADLHQIGGGPRLEQATKAALGPGTGLGVGALAWSGARWVAIPSEGGHISFAVENAEEFAVLERLQAHKDHISAEWVLSGPGLSNLYQALSELRGGGGKHLNAAEISSRAQGGSDPVAAAALDYFVLWLGRFAGDVALAFAAKGGVYLGGGIAPRILERLTDGRFRAAFEAKGRLTGFVASIPLYVILASDAGLRGAAAVLAATLAPR
jgi:glucokinase